jgi:hypothetical protein
MIDNVLLRTSRAKSLSYAAMALTPSTPADSDSDSIARAVAEEERLDALDPLRHYSGGSDDLDSSSAPAQPRNARGEQYLAFGEGVSVTLAIDAGPGCGGLAWPAGEVSQPPIPAIR